MEEETKEKGDEGGGRMEDGEKEEGYGNGLTILASLCKECNELMEHKTPVLG